MSGSNSKRAKVLLVGWDSAGWKMINPLLDRGDLPNLGPFIETGVVGSTATRGLLHSCILANSVATGKHADKHGIFGPFRALPDGTVAQVRGRSRRAKAFWEILSQNDRRCNVVGSPWTEPAEETNGVFVSSDFFQAVPQTYRTSRPVPEGTVCPFDRANDLKDFIVSMEDIDSQTMALFVPRLKEVDPEDRRLTTIAVSLARALSVHAVVTWLMENTDWDVTAVNYPVIEMLWGHFLRYSQPRLEWVDEREADLFGEVGLGAVRLCDLLLGRLLELAGEDTAVILYSARSYLSHEHIERRYLSLGAVPRERLCQPQGIFAMRAAGVHADELVHGVASVDLCPTLLYLSGIKPGEDMDGRALSGAFTEPPAKVETVESWDALPPLREADPDRQLPEEAIAGAGFFASYQATPARRVAMDNAWALAQTLLGTFRGPMALPLLIMTP